MFISFLKDWRLWLFTTIKLTSAIASANLKYEGEIRVTKVKVQIVVVLGPPNHYSYILNDALYTVLKHL